MSDTVIENPVLVSTIMPPELLNLPPQQDSMSTVGQYPIPPIKPSITVPNYYENSTSRLIHEQEVNPQLRDTSQSYLDLREPQRGQISQQTKFSISTMLLQQKDIIRALTHSPAILTNYIHYRGAQEIEFKGATIPIPKVPFIPYNDPSICCIIDKIDGVSQTDEACSNITVRPLGPKGKVGVPYIIQDEAGTMIAKLTQVDKLYSTYLTVPPTSLASFIGRNRAVKHCISDIKLTHIRYIASDEFTNETLIAYILNYLVFENSKVGRKLPLLFVRHYQGGICNKNSGKIVGLNIMENCDLGPLDNLPSHSE